MQMPYRDGHEVVYDATGFLPHSSACSRSLTTTNTGGQRPRAACRPSGEDRLWDLRGGDGCRPFESGGAGGFGGPDCHLLWLCATRAGPGDDHVAWWRTPSGLTPAEVVFKAGDTALLPYGAGTFASRSAVTAGAAIVELESA